MVCWYRCKIRLPLQVSTNSTLNCWLIFWFCIVVYSVFFFLWWQFWSGKATAAMHMTLYNNYTLQTLNISPEAKLCLCSSKVDFLLLLVLLYCCLGWVCCSHIWGQEKSWAIQIEWDKAFYCIIYLFYWKASPPSCSKQTDQTYF